VHVAIEPAQILDDGLVIAQHLVHGETVAAMGALHQNDLFDAGPFTRNQEVLPQSDIRHQLSPQVGQRFPVRLAQILGGQLHALQHVRQGNHEMRGVHPHQQPVDDGQRQRKPQRDGGAPAGQAVNFQQPPQGFHVPPHYIHAHSAAGKVGNLFRR
jgi:hypothetical protein